MESLQSGAVLYTEGGNMNDGEKEKYMLASRLSSFERKVDKSMQIIHEAIGKEGQWVLSFSGGKDSTVLADLLFRCGWRGKGIYFWYSDFENPEENTSQVAWANENYGYDIKKVKCYGSCDAWEEAGHFFSTPTSDEEKSAAKKCSLGFKKASKKFMQENDCKNIFMGMCKEESRARQINLNMRGSTYFVDSRGGYTCCPLSNWSGTDIWAYIVSRDLPYLSIYDLTFWPRERIRNELTVLYCSDLILCGEFTQYRMAYPDLFAKLQKKFPEVREYA
jgi:phosphoadenosine phosphosulfate reductase